MGMVENRNITDEHKNDILLIRLTENEKKQLRKCSLKTGKSMSDLARLGIQMINYDESNRNRLMQNIFLEDISSKKYIPSKEDKEQLLKIRDELSSIQLQLTKLCDENDITNHAPNSWKDSLRDYLIPQIEEALK